MAFEVGARIRRRREAKGLTSAQLAGKLRNREGNPVPYQQLLTWERGKHLPHRQYWPQLARELGIDQGQLFAGAGEEAPDWAMDLSARLDALIGLLGLEDAVQEAVEARARHVPPPERSRAEVGAELDEAEESIQPPSPTDPKTGERPPGEASR